MIGSLDVGDKDNNDKIDGFVIELNAKWDTFQRKMLNIVSEKLVKVVKYNVSF
jgi:hypothetical protein